MRHVRRQFAVSLLGAFLLAFGLGGAAAAQATDADQVLLTLHAPNGDVTLTLLDLDALPQMAFTTSTIWSREPIAFSGPALADVLKAAGMDAQTLRLQAANDYAIEIAPSLVEDDAPILATRLNGRTFSLRERGPIWLAYPYDAEARYRTESAFAASIWQLTHISLADPTPP